MIKQKTEGNVGKVSIIIPVYNEEKTLKTLVLAVEQADFAGLEKEIVLIDDGSSDGSSEILKSYASKHKVLYHKKNQGKGAAVRTGIQQATGDFIVIQDADLEYNPADYKDLMQVLKEDKADVVYGTRFSEKNATDNFLMHHYWGNKMITWVADMIYGVSLTDVETCYKAFKRDCMKDIVLKENSFAFDPELTAKLLKRKFRFAEIPVTYNGRGFEEGKKISWKDGFAALWALLKYKYKE